VGPGGAAYKIQPDDLFKIVETPEQVVAALNEIKKQRGF
jgi:hypothetical protein